MEGTRFDTLTKALRQASPRRRLLGALVGATALRAGLVPDAAEAKKSRHLGIGDRCIICDNDQKANDNAGRCKQACRHGSKCRNNAKKVLKAGEHGRCGCSKAQADCNGQCFNTFQFDVCPVDEFPRCQENDNCLCTRTIEGQAFCALATNCLAPCSSSTDCPNGSMCVTTCCDGPGQQSLHCLPPCS